MVLFGSNNILYKISYPRNQTWICVRFFFFFYGFVSYLELIVLAGEAVFTIMYLHLLCMPRGTLGTYFRKFRKIRRMHLESWIITCTTFQLLFWDTNFFFKCLHLRTFWKPSVIWKKRIFCLLYWWEMDIKILETCPTACMLPSNFSSNGNSAWWLAAVIEYKLAFNNVNGSYSLSICFCILRRSIDKYVCSRFGRNTIYFGTSKHIFGW